MNDKVINDISEYPLSDRHGAYGGMAGAKDGILIDGEYWMVKYPKNTTGMRGNLPPYTSAPLSEYLGSHIFELLGYDTHKTVLGIRNNKLVVACKDFQKHLGDLRELRTLKNAYNHELEEMLDATFHATDSSHISDLNELLIHIKYNPTLSSVPGVLDRFWDMVIIDGLINNNDRNNGNWGLLYDDGRTRIAPIYDNGGAFSSKLPDSQIIKTMAHEDAMMTSALATSTAYGRYGRRLSFSQLVEEGFQHTEFIAALQRNVPLIIERFTDITSFIKSVPESYADISVCSSIRKEFYVLGMKLRLDKILIPAYQRAIDPNQSHETDAELDSAPSTEEKKHSPKRRNRDTR